MPPDVEQHSLPWSITLHLVPGISILIFYVLLAPLVVTWGFQPSFALLLGFLFIGIPLELGFLFYQGYKQNKKFSLDGIVRYRARIPFWHYPIIFFGYMLYAVVILTLTSPMSTYLTETVFSQLPTWFLTSGMGESSRLALLITLTARFLIDGIANPVVEEIYFRGYLLPRISRLGAWAPLLNAVLFASAHLWQPWNIPQIMVLLVPLYYLVWWKRSLYIAVVMHCGANLVGATVAFVAFTG